MSQGYFKSNDNNFLGKSKEGSFEYNEVGLSFALPISDELRFGMQLFSRDIGEYGNNDFNVDWANITSAELQSAGVNWDDVNVLEPILQGGINWDSITGFTDGDVLRAT